MTLAKNRGLILALGGAVVLLGATLLAYRPVAPLGLDAEPTVFSAGRAKEILKDLTGDGIPHPIGSAANANVRNLIVNRLTALGFTEQLQTGFACNRWGACGTPTNIIATFGDPDPKDAVLLAAHYDSVPAGPGASDDGAGVASVLEIARILSIMPKPKHPIALLVTDGEEAGLLGAFLFVRAHPLARHISAAVNMEARGVSGPSLMFETGTANAWLMRLYAATALAPITNSLCYVIYKSLPNDTDFTVFKAAGFQGFNFAFIGDVGRYHTPLDNWTNASASSIQHQGDNALHALLALAGSGDLHPPQSESLFFDVFARAVVVLPTTLALPTALLVLALLLAEGTLLLRHGQLQGREAIFGGLAALGNLLLGGGLSLLVLVLLRAFGAMPTLRAGSWIAHPLPMHFAAAALAFAAAGAVDFWARKRAGFWGLWLGAVAWIVVLSVAVAAALPAASYVLLLPALAAVLATLPCLWRLNRKFTPSPGMTDLAALVPWLAMLAALLPLFLLLYTALGALAWPLVTLTLCLATSCLLPLLAGATLRPRLCLIVVSLGLGLSGVIVTLFAPVYSVRWPQRINAEYVVDADADHAHWWVQSASLRLPAAMAAAASFDSIPRARFPGDPFSGFMADAPSSALASPELTQISATVSAAAAHYELRLRSARGAPTAEVIFPSLASVHQVVVAASSGPLRTELRTLPGGATALRIADIPEAGVAFEIDASSRRLAVTVFDESYGLPQELPGARALQNARPTNATSSQDGDATVVQRTVWLDPAAGR
jgi:hypothetical protein